MASNLKVDIVKPTATNGSLSLKGDSGGSATANGILVNSSGNTFITGTTTTSTASLDGAVTINDSGADVDFRVESDTNTHALFVQGSDGRVGIGASNPVSKTEIREGSESHYSSASDEFSSGSASENLLSLGTGGWRNATIISGITGAASATRNTEGLILNSFYGSKSYSSASMNIDCNDGDGSIQFYTGDGDTAPTQKVSIDSSGNVELTGNGNLTVNGTTTTATLNANNFVGLILPFAYDTSGSPPTGFLECDGSAVSRTTYANLFTAIGTTWGAGNGATTFNIPDLRGAFLRGNGSNGSNTMADGNAFAGPNVGSFENDQFQNITGSVGTISTSGTNIGIFDLTSDIGAFTASLGTGQGAGLSYNGTLSKAYSLAFDASNSTAQGGARAGNETRPFNAGVMYCIKY